MSNSVIPEKGKSKASEARWVISSVWTWTEIMGERVQGWICGRQYFFLIFLDFLLAFVR